MRIPNLVFSTIILFISNFIVRILGFAYRVFLSRAIGATGLGIFNMVINLLMMCVSLTTTGVPVALNSLIAKKKALKDKHNMNVLFISTLYVAFLISLTVSIGISLYSNFLAFKLLKSSQLNIYILAIAPAISLITISNVLRGYYYGIKKVSIPATGQILEQLSKIAFVVLVITYFKNPSMNTLIALIGVSVGEVVNILFTTFNLAKDPDLENKYTVNIREFLNGTMETFKMAVPITCNRMSSVMLQSISSMIIPGRLALSGMEYSKALGLYGIIGGMVYPFLLLPFTVTSALVVNLIPSLSQEVATKNYKNLNKKIYFSLLLTFSVGILASLTFYFFGEPLCLAIFKNKLAGEYLKALSLSSLFIVLNHTLSGILNSIGKEYISSINNIIGMCIQLIAIYFLLPIPSLNIYGYIYTLNVTSILTFLLQFTVLMRAKTKLKGGY